jgi:hypothetical protein
MVHFGLGHGLDGLIDPRLLLLLPLRLRRREAAEIAEPSICPAVRAAPRRISIN